MKILFDHQAFTMQKYGGISRYYAELLNQNKIDKKNEINVASIFSNNEYLSNDDNNKKINTSSFYPFKGKATSENWLNSQYSLYKIKQKSYDIFHPTYYDTYFLKYIKNKPFTVTFYDLIHEKYVNRYDELLHDKAAINNKLQLLDRANKVIAISESTKKDIIEFYNVAPDKIEVIYLASSLSPNFTNSDLIGEPYFLFIGSRLLYKNFKFLIKAIKDLLLNEKIKLVCGGGGEFSASEIEYIASLGLQDLVIYKHINDTTLAQLYTSALAFIFPSIYEGFGIPVLEAMSCGCPCLLSNSSSLPEIGGEAALYFDAEIEDSIVNAVRQILYNAELKDDLKVAGYKRHGLFSWEKTYNETIELYKTLI